VILVCLLVLAGCSGFADGGSDAGTGRGASEPGASVTPAPVPTTEPTATPGPPVAPGLARTGVWNASALAAAHESVLRNASMTVRRTTTYRYGSGEIARQVVATTRIGSEGRRLRVVERRSPPTDGEDRGETTARSGTGAGDEAATGGHAVVREAYWFGPNRSTVARTYANGTTTYRARAPSDLTRDRRSIVTSEARRIGALAGGFETRVRAVGSGERPRYRVRSAEKASGSDRTVPIGFTSVSSFRMTIDSRGLVGKYRFLRRLNVQRRGKPTEILTRVHYIDVGTTTVTRPPWYDAVMSTTSATNRTE
jgi:hypothetical protein